MADAATLDASQPRSSASAAAVARLLGALVILARSAAAAALPARARPARHGRPPRRRRSCRPRGWVWPVSEVPPRPPVRRARAQLRRRSPRNRPRPPRRALDAAPPPPASRRSRASVAGRGILTIDHGDGLVTTLEPIEYRASTAGRHRRFGSLEVTPPGDRLGSPGRYINRLLLGAPVRPRRDEPARASTSNPLVAARPGVPPRRRCCRAAVPTDAGVGSTARGASGVTQARGWASR